MCDSFRSLVVSMTIDLWYDVFFFNESTTTEIYTYCHALSRHDALPISGVEHELGPMRLDVAVLVARGDGRLAVREIDAGDLDLVAHFGALAFGFVDQDLVEDRKSTRLNSSH